MKKIDSGSNGPSASGLLLAVAFALLVNGSSAFAQHLLSSLGGWVYDAPTSTSDHLDGKTDRTIPRNAVYCWVARAPKCDIGIVYNPDGTYYGILYSTMVGYDVRTSPYHVVQKSNPSNRTEVSVSLWNFNRSGMIRFKRESTGTVKEVPFEFGACPSQTIPLATSDFE
ncbi:MAG: hypothetical protein EBX52_09800 [Proteobacteria bacterium]|nr:hypothetical protein [Pseudomonadota bacterium]